MKCDREQLSKMFSNTLAAMENLGLFWRHSNCDAAVEILTADATPKSTFLYGVDSAQLVASASKENWKHYTYK